MIRLPLEGHKKIRTIVNIYRSFMPFLTRNTHPSHAMERIESYAESTETQTLYRKYGYFQRIFFTFHTIYYVILCV